MSSPEDSVRCRTLHVNHDEMSIAPFTAMREVRAADTRPAGANSRASCLRLFPYADSAGNGPFGILGLYRVGARLRSP